MLKNRNAIETHNETVTTRLIVCNYNAYNKQRNANETQTERKPKRTRNACGTQTETEEEGKERKKVKNDKTLVAMPPPKKVAKVTWLTPYYDVWTEVFGSPPPKEMASRIAQAFSPLQKQYSPKDLIGAWKHYLRETQPQFSNPQTFAGKARRWVEDWKKQNQSQLMGAFVGGV